MTTDEAVGQCAGLRSAGPEEYVEDVRQDADDAVQAALDSQLAVRRADGPLDLRELMAVRARLDLFRDACEQSADRAAWWPVREAASVATNAAFAAATGRVR